MATRFDTFGRLGKVKRTAQGGISVPATLARTGILEYIQPDGSVRREYRSPEEVFSPESLASLANAPVTNLHPSELITPENFAAYSRGHVEGVPRQDGNKILGDLVIQDARLIRLIDRGNTRNEVSCGYTAKIVEGAGVTPEGERYDARQTQIRYNHTALVPSGRAGSEVAIRLDAEGDQIPHQEEDNEDIMKERINGTVYEVGTDAHTAACVARDLAEGQAVAAGAALQARLDAADAEVARLTEAHAAVDVAALVSARLRLIDRARTAGAEVRLDMSDEEITLATVAKLLPNQDVTGKSADYVTGMIEYAIANPPSTSQAVRQDASGDAPTISERSPAEEARINSIKNANKGTN